MKFVSYAQNFEDIRLWRALKFFDKGFYIDVGANDPSVDSVTRAFYDRGWTGINIEPVQAFHGLLSQQRPKDITFSMLRAMLMIRIFSFMKSRELDFQLWLRLLQGA